jgi:predicted small secreted protein
MARLMLVILVAVAAPLAGCNTIHGIGKDIEAAGEAIQRKSR